MARLRRGATLVGVNLAATLALLGLAEVLSRTVRPTPLPDPVVTEDRAQWLGTREYDPLLFWRMRPGLSREGKPFTNALGLRGPEVGPKGPDEFRILSLGESTTFAARLPYRKSYSGLLEELLPRIDDKEVRVINAGVPGYTLFQGVAYLRLRGLRLRPDAVIVYFGFNDYLRVSFRAERDDLADAKTAGLTDRELHRRRSAVTARLTYALQVRSNLVRALTLPRSPPTRAEIRRGRRRRVPEEDRRALLEELRDLCAERGVRLVVVIPWYREFGRHIDLLREAGEWKGVLLVDLPLLLTSHYERRHEVFFDPVHPNAEGHRLIAGAIAKVLRESWKPRAAESGGRAADQPPPGAGSSQGARTGSLRS